MFWQTEDRKTLTKIIKLLAEIERDPYSGIGKPERLQYEYSGYWSREIDKKNRIVYTIVQNGENSELLITQCGTHYSDK